MPKRLDIHKILVIGSGPIVIGQAAEFDYAGTQACLALREEGYEVILCNSNPATIMTDTVIADKVYMEPLTLEYLARIIRHERPDAIIPGLGGQTGLNLAMQLERKGVLRECQTELLGTKSESIARAEDREQFKALCERLGEPVLPSVTVETYEEGKAAAAQIGFPLVLRPAFTLGGSGGGFAENEEEFQHKLAHALEVSPVHQVLVEKSVKGFKEIEYEVMRDANDTAIAICNMENLDPVGVHTGDSIVVCPSQTLTNREYQMLRDSALKIIRALDIEGGCNVQFALDPRSFQYYLIEVNPRVSRSSALASKASGYPIARVSAKVAVGMTLDEIALANTPACFEPALDYIVCKMPRFPFDKFITADNHLGTQMKATGEVMSIGRTFEESLLKAVRCLETGTDHLWKEKFDSWSKEQLMTYCSELRDDRIYGIAQLLRLGTVPEEIARATQIDLFFIRKIRNITAMETCLSAHPGDIGMLKAAKKMGFGDKEAARCWQCEEEDIYRLRRKEKMFPVYKMIDSAAAEFDSYIPYFYSTYEAENESVRSDRKKIIVLGSGPIRIGQGIEFDYSSVHAVKTIKEAGFEAVIINNNPETVSTDYTTSDKLYFEPLTPEDVCNIVELEKPWGVIASLGGQTAVNLVRPLTERGVPIIGTGNDAIDRAENRELFEKLLEDLDIPRPKGRAVTNVEDGLKTAEEIGYPVLLRPSFVLGGRAMQIVSDPDQLRRYMARAVTVSVNEPVLVDHYIQGKELEVDAVCDGEDVFCPGIMELVERTGVHSGDSISVFPTFSISEQVRRRILAYTQALGLGIGIRGLYNIQFIVDEKDDVYIIEVNPRASRTVPFLSKAAGYCLTDIAAYVMLGRSLKQQGLTELCPEHRGRWYVKAPAFSFAKLSGMDTYLSPEMKSTGEAIGYDQHLRRALYKAMQASGMRMRSYGTVFAMIDDKDKDEAFPLMQRFYDLGFNIEATRGTALFLKERGIRTHISPHLSEGSAEILEKIRQGFITYVIQLRDIRSEDLGSEGRQIRACAAENNVTMMTSLDTVSVLLDSLEEITFTVSTIDEK